MAIPLRLSNLERLSGTVAKPGYDRSTITPGIVHIGVGNFHRAHQAYYLDSLFGHGSDHDWGIVGAGVKPGDVAMRERLLAQDCLSTIVELDPEIDRARICASMVDYVACEPAALIDALSQPEIRIVSLTITEGGYFQDVKTGGFLIDDPEVAHDIANPDRPSTVFGILAAALHRRRLSGAGPLTVMSCDNLPGNGDVAKQSVLGIAAGWPGDLAQWIEGEVAFPSGMVDCITPAAGDSERKMVAKSFGVVDAAPVICEPFRQWVLEDRFAAGRPGLEMVGVEFVSDVAPYELMKLRILNGGHAVIAYAAALLGIETVDGAMGDSRVRRYLERVERDEIVPTIPAIPGVDFARYVDQVAERFANPKVGDTIGRLCVDGSNRQPKFILPTIADRLAVGASIDGLALEVALWCRFCAGVDEAGNPFAVQDERSDRLTDRATRSRTDPRPFLDQPDVFGQLAHNDAFVSRVSLAIGCLWNDGVAAGLERYAATGELTAASAGRTAVI